MANDHLTLEDIERARKMLDAQPVKPREPIYITRWLADCYIRQYGSIPTGMQAIDE